MENKNSMSRVERLHREKVTRYSIRKYSFGAASVAVAALFMFLGNGAVSADMTAVQPQDESGLKAKPTDENAELPQVEKEVAQPAESTPAAQPIAEEPTAKPAEPATPALDKKQLENYIAEIEAKLSNGSYANKTDESVAVLKADLEAAKTTLANATSQDELTKAYNKLVTTANTKLKNKPTEKKETPAVDTTNGKETVGKKAENTEKKSDSNSIENTGSNDSRNGQALDKNNAFRAETTETHGNFNYSMEYSTGKEIYLYNEEEADVNITVNSTAGNITKATVKAGSGQFLLKSKSDQAIAYTKFGRGSMPPEEEVERDDYGWSYRQTLTETPGPVTINITGKPNDKFKELKSYTKTEDQRAVLGARYLQLQDSNGNRLSGGSNLNAPGAFNLVVKSQTYKYDIKDLTEERRITVNDINNITTTDLTTIKSRLKLEYSKKSNDARFESLKGTEVTNPTSLIDTVAVSTTDSSKLVVTYVDGSTDEIEKSKVLNVKPAGIIPFSNPTTKEIYVYKGEETNLEFGVTDDSGKVKDLRIVQGSANINNSGAARGQVKNEYGLTMTSETNGNGIVATTANPATTRITGTISVPGKPNYVGPLMTRYLVAEDLDGAIFSNPDANKNLDQEGAFKLVVREQTQKFDIQGQTEENNKIAVSDVNNLSDADFENIKNNIKIQYKTSDDERLKDKDGTLVENASQYIQSITKEGDKIVVTYKDGSTDKLELSSVVRTNPAPTVELPYSNADKRQIYVYTGENTDLTFKASDDAALKKVYLRGPGNKDFDNAAGYGFTTGKINDGALESGEGTVASDKQNATIKMTGVTNLKAGKQWTSIIVAEDEDNAKSTTNFDSSTDFAVRQQRPGYVEFVVKDQTSKYDIKAPTEKVAVTDPANVTEDELAKIKEKLQLEYKKDNDDANVAKDADVTDKDAKIDSVTKDDQGNLVVTYKDGSKDTRPLSEFVTLDKQPAINEVNKAAEKQIEAINKTPNATDEEKQAAIDKVNADKEKALTAINDANLTTKTALDAAQKVGTDAIAKDNPVVAKKDEAKADVEAARKAKEDAIKANPNLSDEEKDAAIAKVNRAAEDAKKAIDAATSNADVETAKGTGTTAIDNVTPVAKTAAKKAIADSLTAKNAELDKRTDLTDEEKTAAKAEAQKLADAQLAEIAKQPDAADTKEAAKTAQDAVNAAGTKGAADVAAVNPEAKSKPSAKKAIDDKLAEQLKTIENTPDATTDEKKVAADAAKALADEAKKEIDKAGTDAEVKQLQKEAEGEIEKSVPVVEDKPNARKAIDDEATAKKAAIDARDDLTPKAKEDLKAQVDKIAEQAKKSVDAAKTAEAVNGIEESDKAAIKAVGEVNIPADKVLVNDPSALTDAEKAKVLEAVKKVNPDAKEITQDADGNITVTTPDGHQEIITPEQVVKTADTANDPKAGNDVVKPADKVVVNDPAKLTDAEKEKIKAAVEAVNPNSIVVVDDKGNAKVSTPDGQTQVIPVEELVRTVEDTKKPNAGNDIVKPADKTVVANPDALTPEEKKAIEDKVKAVNPGATVAVDDKGNATVTTPEGKTAVIPAADLTKDPEAATKPNAGNDIVKPADKTVVADPEKLTDAEKKAIEDKVKAVNPDATVVVDDKGNATVTTPEGKTAVIPASDLTKDPEAATKPNAGNDIVKPADKTVVADPEKLTDAEKKAIEDKVKAVNPDATVVVDDKGNATVTTPEGKTAVIPAADLTKDPAAATKPNAGNDIVKPADKTVVADPEKLTDAEKKAIEDKVKAVNPDATVVVDDKGNATVTTPEGKTAVIPATDLTKSPEEAAKANAGNDIVKPADKTVVANPEKLTDAEKKAIEDKVKAVNPDATVVVDDKGNATVTTPEGKTAVIPATDLTKSPEEAAKANAGNDIVKPADKTVVANPEKLTDAEKKAIEDKVKAVNPDATVVVDDKGNATVTTPEGKTAVIPAADLTKDPAAATKPNAGNAVNTPASKVEVKDPANLTDEEKAKVKKAIEAVNPGSKVVVDDKGNATVTTPEGNTAVIPAADVTKSAADAGKANAGNAVNTPASKVEVKDPANLTPEEKKAIEDKVKAVNPDATVVVDDKGNATVTTPEGKTAVIPATDLTKDPEAATKPNAGNAVNTPASKVEVKDPAKLTDEEKAKVKEAIEAVNPGSKVVVDDKGNATVTTPEGNTAVIPAADVTKSAADAGKANAGNAVNTPASKVEVKDPANLTDAEKKAIEDKVKAVNPGSKVVVDDKGNATVTTPEGKTATIPATDLTKSASDAGKENAGNGANTPATKTVVKDPANLTDEEKAKVKKAVEDVNPGSTVVVNDKGDVIVTKGDGTVLVIPELDLVIPEDKLTDPTQQNGVNTPATRVLVGDKAKLTADEIEKVKESIKAVNPGSTVVVDENGNATVTTPEGKTATIPAAQLVKDAKDVAAKNNGENINVDFEKETVADFNNLTDAEKEAAKAKIKGANADVVEVIFDKAGNATVITKDGKVYTIVAKDIFKQRPYVPSNGGDNNSGNGNGATNTDAKVDKAKLEGAIHQLDELIIKESAKLDAETAKEANALSADAKKVFANADASQAEVDAMVKRIEDFMAKVASSTDHAAPANDQAAQTSAVAPATAQAAANAGQTASAQANARKAAKELPNTGTADSTVAMVAAAASAVLGLGLAGRRRKEDEEA